MRRTPSLDGLRAVAITAVVVYHVFQGETPSVLPGGWAGVDVFFVLSGYLITRLLREEIAGAGRIDFRKFYMRRTLRIIPAFVALLVFEIVVWRLTRPVGSTSSRRCRRRGPVSC